MLSTCCVQKNIFAQISTWQHLPQKKWGSQSHYCAKQDGSFFLTLKQDAEKTTYKNSFCGLVK